MTVIVGLIGRIGSGKTAIAEYVAKNHGAEVFRFSNILSDILERLHLAQSRKNLQDFGVSLREFLGEDIIVNAMKGDLMASRAKLIVVDGIRYQNEADMIKRQGRCFLIYVMASPKVRYDRCVARSQRGEGQMSFEDFMKADNAGTEREIGRVSSKADFIIGNEGSLEDLYRRVKEIITEIKSKFPMGV